MNRFPRLNSRVRDHNPMQADSVLVIGLGRFGGALAETLVELGTEVLAVDFDGERVQDYSERLTHVRQADTTSAAVLRQIGAADFSVAVVAIGNDIESSILTTAALSDLGIPNIWAKAIRLDHGRILERVGAHHVVYPERQMGIRTAHAVSGRVIDYFELDPGFVLAEVRPPRKLIGKTLAQADIRNRYGVTIVCVKPSGAGFTYATPETCMAEGDILVVAGDVEQTEAFAALH